MGALSRADLARAIDLLTSGALSREEVADWAAERHVSVAEDPAIEEALDLLALIDARHVSDEGVPMNYMYDFVEILAVREVLDSDDDPSDS